MAAEASPCPTSKLADASHLSFPEPVWWPRARGPDGLLANEPLEPGNYLIRRRRPGPDEKMINEFTRFISVEHIYVYMMTLPELERDLYEVVQGDQKQRGHFDIDITVGKNGVTIETLQATADSVMNQLIAAISVDVPPPLIAYYTSHSKSKRSFHVILAVYHNNNREARLFYQRCLGRIDDQLKQFVDHAVYSSLQNFRLLYAQKWHSGRTKVLAGQEGQPPDLDQFRRSLLTLIDGCIELPMEIAETKMAHDPLACFQEDELATQVIQLLCQCTGKEQSELPFTVRGAADNRVTLTRVFSSFCSLCQRVHDSDNGYVQVKADGSAYYQCFRNAEAQGNAVFLGNIKLISNPQADVDPDQWIQWYQARGPIAPVILETKRSGGQTQITQIAINRESGPDQRDGKRASTSDATSLAALDLTHETRQVKPPISQTNPGVITMPEAIHKHHHGIGAIDTKSATTLILLEREDKQLDGAFRLAGKVATNGNPVIAAAKSRQIKELMPEPSRYMTAATGTLGLTSADKRAEASKRTMASSAGQGKPIDQVAPTTRLNYGQQLQQDRLLLLGQLTGGTGYSRRLASVDHQPARSVGLAKLKQRKAAEASIKAAVASSDRLAV